MSQHLLYYFFKCMSGAVNFAAKTFFYLILVHNLKNYVS